MTASLPKGTTEEARVLRAKMKDQVCSTSKDCTYLKVKLILKPGQTKESIQNILEECAWFIEASMEGCIGEEIHDFIITDNYNTPITGTHD